MSNWRIFDPVVKGFDSWSKPSDVVWYDHDDEVSRICKVSRRSRTPVVMWIDGACRGNGTDWASAGYGIYLGPRSCYNRCGQLPSREHHSSQAAEIYAASVRWVMDKMGEEVCEDGVVIVTDSDYLFRSMTDYIYRWVDNGFLNAHGRPVTNGAAFAKLHNSMCEWEEYGIMIRFWKVPREWNGHADCLANRAVD